MSSFPKEHRFPQIKISEYLYNMPKLILLIPGGSFAFMLIILAIDGITGVIEKIEKLTGVFSIIDRLPVPVPGDLLIFKIFYIGCVVMTALIVWGVFFVPKKKRDKFYNDLPVGYGYPYYIPDFGYAINVKEKKIIIESKGKRYTIPLDKIRRFTSRSLDGGTIISGPGGSLLQMNSMQRQLDQLGFRQGGVFFDLESIETPILQVRHATDADINRSDEILRQWFDGKLIDFADYIKNPI